MKWKKLIIAALKSLQRNKMRGSLTILGIIIGVGSVIALMSLGRGSQSDVERQISSLGTNLIMIRPGSDMRRGVSGGIGSMKSLTLKDIDLMRANIRSLQAITPVINVGEQVVAGGKNWSTSISGVLPEYLKIKNLEISSGRMFTESDVKGRTKVAVVGKTVVKELFNGNDPVGATIRIRNVPFRVIGVLAEKGQGGMGEDLDDTVLAPSTTVLYRLSDGETINMIMTSAVSEEAVESVKTDIAALVRTTHKIQKGKEDDFHIMDQKEIKDMMKSVTGTLTLLLSAVASVSLLVGGVGIMNIMLVSVTERTREIGIRLTVGARPGDILIQFLIEAMILSAMGGIIGIFGGLGIAYLFGGLSGSSVVVSWGMVLLAFFFSGAVGVFFGYYPAYKAANLNPIEALRHE